MKFTVNAQTVLDFDDLVTTEFGFALSRRGVDNRFRVLVDELRRVLWALGKLARCRQFSSGLAGFRQFLSRGKIRLFGEMRTGAANLLRDAGEVDGGQDYADREQSVA